MRKTATLREEGQPRRRAPVQSAAGGRVRWTPGVLGPPGLVSRCLSLLALRDRARAEGRPS